MGEKKSEKIDYQVALGKTFNRYYLENYPKNTVTLIDDFIDHFEENGFYGWKGKIGPSNKVPESYVNKDELIDKANKFQLWHVHIGDPCWHPTQHGKYFTSDWVLTFKKLSNYKIVLLELSWHDPMLLPNDEICNE